MSRCRNDDISPTLAGLVLGRPNGLDVRLSATGGDIAPGQRAAQELSQHANYLFFQPCYARKQPRISQVGLQKHVRSLYRYRMGTGAHGGEEAVIAVVALSRPLQNGHYLICRKGLLSHFGSLT